jgi:hypothetical protein
MEYSMKGGCSGAAFKDMSRMEAFSDQYNGWFSGTGRETRGPLGLLSRPVSYCVSAVIFR